MIGGRSSQMTAICPSKQRCRHKSSPNSPRRPLIRAAISKDQLDCLSAGRVRLVIGVLALCVEVVEHALDALDVAFICLISCAEASP